MSKTISLVLAMMILLPLSICAQEWKSGSHLSEKELRGVSIEKYFVVSSIDDATFKRMQEGGSFPQHCTTARSDLRYLRLLHYDYEGKVTRGELVCNKAIAADLRDIFLELYKQEYPIERMRLIDDYRANDENSMSHNNTSAFCFRKVNGTKVLSKHSRGLAIDVNPLHNPCVKLNADGKISKVQPNTKEAKECANRTTRKSHMIDTRDLCYRLFVKHGFKWGGAWKRTKDYQHFER